MRALHKIGLGILGLFAGSMLQAKNFELKEVEVPH